MWLAVHLSGTGFQSPQATSYSTFPHPYKIRMHTYFHYSSFFPYSAQQHRPFCGQDILKHLYQSEHAFQGGRGEEKCFTVINLSLQWTLAFNTPTRFPRKKKN